MNTLDIGIIIILILLIVHGAYRGLVRQIFSLGALIVGIILAGRYYSLVGSILEPLVLEPLLANMIGGAVIFAGASVTLILMGGIIHRAVVKTELSGANRMAGAVFGGLKSLVLILAGIGIMTVLIKGQSPLMHNSFVVPRALSVLQRVTPIFPVDYRRAMETRLKIVQQEIKRFRRSGDSLRPQQKRNGRK
ncbi:MAG: CvpA family protein [Deltaproteobacteria bacterium]|nr:CvpA family protein [Deltaproteobacteria bacterium]MBW2306844.1 CvpA family protein [Deltaproteobacteria bacterium]